MRAITGLQEGVRKALLCVGNAREWGRGGSWSSSEVQKHLHRVAEPPKCGLHGLTNGWARAVFQKEGSVLPCSSSWCFAFGLSTQGKRSAREARA